MLFEQQDWIDARLVKHHEGVPVVERALRAQAITKLSALLTEDDWQALAIVAAKDMAEGVLQVAQLEALPLVAV